MFSSSARRFQISVTPSQYIFPMHPLMCLICLNHFKTCAYNCPMKVVTPLHSKDAPESCCRGCGSAHEAGGSPEIAPGGKMLGSCVSGWIIGLLASAIIPLYPIMCLEELLIGWWLSCVNGEVFNGSLVAGMGLAREGH